MVVVLSQGVLVSADDLVFQYSWSSLAPPLPSRLRVVIVVQVHAVIAAAIYGSWLVYVPSGAMHALTNVQEIVPILSEN